MNGERVSASLRRRVRLRSGGRCEYCLLPVASLAIPSHVDHVIPRKHGGDTTLGNLAHCCASCNLHKGSDVAGFDQPSGRLTRVYNPRTQAWPRHFHWAGPLAVGRTATGRVTVRLLKINGRTQVQVRGELMSDGLM